ncbi:MAG: hypothetical protein ACXU82_06545 [Caulobacteraceae bacterium]
MAATARQPVVQPEVSKPTSPVETSPIEALALLTSGGDARVALDPASGLNRYGCGASPDAAIVPFGSSTCSTISTAAFTVVERLAGRLSEETAHEGRAELYRQELARIRSRLVSLFGLQDMAGLKTILSPSGTDLHRVALMLTAAGAATPPLVILPEPDETGGGVVTALGGKVGPAAALRAAMAAPNLDAALLQPQIMTARSRAANGTLRPAHEIDEEIVAIAAAAANARRKVLLVMMDVSKTGLISPSVACAQDLKQRFGDRIEVLVDACQLRLSPHTVAAYLRQDFLVAVTGSKFMTGPAFSAALLVPPAAAERIQASRLPRGLADVCLQGELPEDWRGAPELQARANFGLVLRWEAALEEMRRFAALPPAAVARFFGDFAASVGERLADDEAFEAVAVRPLERTGLGGAPSWDRIQTIFPFVAKRGGRLLTPIETLSLQRLMTVDLGDWAGWEGAGRRIQLGQPVHCGRRGESELSALRLCLSARLAVEALAPGGCGAAAMIDEALLALDKAAWLTTRLADR